MNYYIPRVKNDPIALKNAIWHFQQNPCPHCQHSETLKSHGLLLGTNQQTKGFRLFCSNRNSNHGCGKTISIVFEDVIQGTQLLADEASKLLQRLCSTSKSEQPRSVEEAAEGICSRATAYRWRKKMQLSQSHFRSLTSILNSPPRMNANSLESTWAFLQTTFSGAKSILGGFQLIFQCSAFQRVLKSRLPNSHRASQHQPFQHSVATKDETRNCKWQLPSTEQLAIPLKI